MTDSKSTKAELLAELEAVRENAEAWIERAKKAEKVIVPVPSPVPEANGLANAIRALDGVTAAQRTYNGETQLDRSAIARILKHLADRYGVALIETKYEPCARAHLDELDPTRVADALRSGYVR